MGYSMRTDRYRFTEWVTKNKDEVIARELYDHRTDPQENINLAAQAGFQSLVNELAAQRATAWREAHSPFNNQDTTQTKRPNQKLLLK